MTPKLIAASLICLAAAAQPQFAGAPAFDAVIQDAVKSQLIPGAVLEIGNAQTVLYRHAYGSRALIPQNEPMTEDTVFDVASLTKVIATTSALMKLVEQNKVRPDDPVTAYLPDFQGGKSPITVRNLLTHYSGLRPDLDLAPAWSGYETGIAKALADAPKTPPATKFVYSDINFILLGEIVRKVSGRTLPDFTHDEIFHPLAMDDTRFNPPSAWRPKIAPTELDPATNLPLRGVVHDETSRYMGGVAGHAGLFSTADNLGRFARMMLNRGQTIFTPATVERFTTPQSPIGQSAIRGFGWDIDSPYSGNRGERFPIGSYGHTGFTGTSIWIDPTSQTYVILLANSVHPHRGKSLTNLRSKVATLAAQYTAPVPPTPRASLNVQTGLDVLAAQHFAPLAGKRVGLITNHTGLSRDGKRNIDLMLTSGIKVVAIFTPEHGLAGKEDREHVASTQDPASGIPAISLYDGPTRRLTPAMLHGVDALVFDIQDIGARFYTYSCTLVSSLEEGARKGIPFYVLDRPNPITGEHAEGPLLDPGLQSFVGCHDMPLRHGLTFGELASMVNGERNLGLKLNVIKMTNWSRTAWFDETGLPWVNPSPNMRSLKAATLYPGVAMLEASKNYSVGRGTDTPFEHIGADWIDGHRLAALLNARFIPGLRVYPTQFQPTASNFQGKTIQGVRFEITDRNRFQSLRLGLELGYALEKLYPGKIPWDTNRFLIGNQATVAAGKSAADPELTLAKFKAGLETFQTRRQKYLLY